jgi:diguanylate cyclase (GGDEF)-like protein
MLFMIIMLIVLHFVLRREKPGIFSHLAPYIGFAFFMAYGIFITANDQLTTGNITTYVMVCLVLGSVYLLRPSHSIILFGASFIAFNLFALPMAQTETNRLSSFTNALTMTSISTLLSIIMWQYNRTNILQKRQIINQQQRLEKANQNLVKMAYFDSLTELPNRRYFDDIIKKETALMLRKNHESCLIMLDIDHFKEVNDCYGHPAGDKLLVQVSSLLLQNIRQYDTLCRLGGEEFIILLPQTTLDEAGVVANHLLLVISSNTFFIEDFSLNITASSGVSRLVKDADATLIEQYAYVDKALYQAKKDGRNCVRIA